MASAYREIKTVRSLRPESAGGGSRIRTGDILLAKQTLYQLSYTPMSNEQVIVNSEQCRGTPLSTYSLLPITYSLTLVGLTRVELVTSSLSGTRSNQLSYKPLVFRKGDGTLC